MAFRLQNEWIAPIKRDDDTALLVGQREWCYLIPPLHHGLMDPVLEAVFPRLPNGASQMQASPYWESALYLCRYLLGWVDVGLGLQWWEQAGRPTSITTMGGAEVSVPELEALQALYAWHPDFPAFALWNWSAWGDHYRALGVLARGGALTLDYASTSLRRPALFRDEAYVKAAEAPRHQPVGGGSPWIGGTNPLHLGHSAGTSAGGSRSQGVELVVSSKESRRAVLLLDRLEGWYGQLCARGEHLPQSGWDSFHVEVVVKPLGWLGTFRRSGDSGLWFRGRHSVHMHGFPNP